MVQQSPGPAGVSGGLPGTRPAAGLSAGLVATVAGGGLLLAFVLQNRDDVTLNLLWWSFTVPLWLFTIAVAVLGSVVWIGLGVLRRHRRRKARRAARAD
jgi:uncharacterized integral membrane protein